MAALTCRTLAIVAVRISNGISIFSAHLHDFGNRS